MELENLVRLLVMIFGGSIVGAGLVVLDGRRRFYKRIELRPGCGAMIALSVVNALVMSFIAVVLISRWDEPLTWRTGFAATIFVIKGLFFYLLFRTGVEQNRRALYGT